MTSNLPFDPFRSSTVYVALAFLSRGILSGRLVVASGKKGRKTFRTTRRHPALSLLHAPTPWHDYNCFIKAVVLQTLGSRTGDSFAIKARNAAGEVIGLLPVAGHYMHSVGDPFTGKPERWDYKLHLGGEAVPLPLTEVVHFRNGVNPHNPARGLSDFEWAECEMQADASFTTLAASLARNMGIPSTIIAPASGSTIPPEDVQDIARSFSMRTTGDNSGAPLVLRGAVEVQKPGPPPSSMDIDALARSTGERLIARLGLSFLGLGIPDSRGTHQNFGEAARSNWDNGVLPLAHSMAEALTHHLLRPDYYGPADQRFEFDFSDCAAFREDEGLKADRAGKLYQYGVLQRDESRGAVGFKPLGGEDGDFIKSAVPTRQSLWDDFTKSLDPESRKALAHLRPKAAETKVVLSLDTPSTRKG